MKGELFCVINIFNFQVFKNRYHLTNFLILLCLALIASYVPFLGHFVNISHDGVYHLARFQQITEAFKAGEIPQVLNFKYVSPSSYSGVAINSFYPWITGLIFIIPNLIFHNPLWAIACGYVILNFITLLSIHQLLTYLKVNGLALYTGIIIYEFNNFHMLDLYSRMAIGEVIAYAFFPLVILGLLMIEHHNKYGYLFLGLSLGLIINTHILSFIIALILVVIYGLIIIFKRTDFKYKFIQLIKAGITSFILGFYVIYNIIFISMNNGFLSPPKYITPLNPDNTLQAILSSSLAEQQSAAWNLGAPVTILLLSLFILSLFKSATAWKRWIIASAILFFIIFSWLPYNLIATSPIGLIQFTARLLAIVVLLMAIGSSLFIQKGYLRWSSITIINIFIIAVSLTATYNFHYNYLYQNTGGHVKLSSSNYYQTLETTHTFTDYLPTKNKQSKIVALNGVDFNKATIVSKTTTIDSVSFKINSKSNQTITLPVALYKDLHYVIYTNGNKMSVSKSNIATVKVKTGTNKIVVKSIGNYHLFALIISLFSLIGLLLYIFWSYIKNYNEIML